MLLLRRRGGRLIPLRPAEEAEALLLALAAAAVVVAPGVSATAAAAAAAAAAALGRFARFGAFDAPSEVGRDPRGALPAGGDEVDGCEVLQGLPLAPQVLDDCVFEGEEKVFFFSVVCRGGPG